MSRQYICVNEADEADARRAVSRVVRWFRSQGHKNEHAIELAAYALDATPRRVWSLSYVSQLVKVARIERDLLVHRMWAHMDREAAELRERADEIERQAEAERLATAQLTLPLLGGEITCSQPSSRGSVSGDGASRLNGGK